MRIKDKNEVTYELNKDDLTASIVETPKENGSIFIPRFIEHKKQKYKIISIGDNAFRDNKIESLEFSQDSEMKIFKKDSFYWCKINKLQIPASLETIDEDWVTFLSVKFIEVSPKNKNFSCIDNKLLIGKSDPKQDKFDSILMGSIELETVDIPSSIRFIKKCSFHECDKLKTINIKEDSQLEVIYSFGLCRHLQILYIPKLLNYIDKYVFTNLEQIEEIRVSPKNQKFKLLDDKYLLMKNEQTNIFDELVYSVNINREATIPGNVKIINGNALRSEKLEVLNFPNNSQIEKIDDVHIPNLRKLTIPKNLYYICPNIFIYTKKLTDFEISSENTYFSLLENKCLIRRDSLLFCPRNIEEVTIPRYIEKISDYAFYYCNNLTSVAFESNSSLKVICHCAFAECISLTKIIFPPSVEKIDDSICSGSFELKFIQFLGEKISTSDSSFSCCFHLKLISFPNALELVFNSDIEKYTKVQVLKNVKLSGRITTEYKDNIQYIESESEFDEYDDISSGSIDIGLCGLLTGAHSNESNSSETSQPETETIQKENEELKALIKENEELKKKISSQETQIKEQENLNKQQKKQIDNQTKKINELQNELNKMTKEKQNKTPQVKNNINIEILDVEMIKTLRKIKLLGRGSAGEVVKVGKEEYYAQKNMNFEEEFDFNRFKQFIKEYEILNLLNHPNIIKVYGICNGDESTPPSILMEFCQTNLDKLITKNLLSSVDKVIIIYQIAEGFRYVHFKGIIHRDIKSRNILIKDDKIVKICDFGISKITSPDDTSLTSGIGTQKYMAPEIINESKHYTEKVDVYSFGVLIFFILCGKMPEITVTKIGQGLKADIPNSVNEFSRQLINDCWSFEPETRPSFKEICERLRKSNFGLIKLNQYEQREVLSFVEKHDQSIPKFEQTETPLGEIKSSRNSKPKITHPRAIKPKTHKV